MTTDEAGHILLADDEPAFQRLAAAWLTGFGHRVTLTGTADAALAQFRASPPDAVLLDLAMPPRMTPEAGIELVPAFASVPVVILTAHADHELVLRAAAAGAWDFLVKPVEPEMLRFVIGRAVRQARLARELHALRTRDTGENLGLIGSTEPMQRLRDLVRRLGPTSISILILGPTGTGKELVARALHATSPRRDHSFVALHCGALAAELLEAELFGHLKGSFTGAHADRPGLLQAAHRGTLFLDEVGEMPMPMQVKLLRFLQEGQFTPVGGREPKHADVRILAATHRDIETMVADGRFREDLFYRLKGFILRTPTLAERRADIPLLATLFLRRATLTQDAITLLTQRDWPGNVRELRALVETAGALATDATPVVDATLLRFASGETSPTIPDEPTGLGVLDAAIAELETRMIREALEASGGNRSEAARRLEISRVGLLKKMTRLDLR